MEIATTHAANFALWALSKPPALMVGRLRSQDLACSGAARALWPFDGRLWHHRRPQPTFAVRAWSSKLSMLCCGLLRGGGRHTCLSTAKGCWDGRASHHPRLLRSLGLRIAGTKRRLVRIHTTGPNHGEKTLANSLLLMMLLLRLVSVAVAARTTKSSCT